MELVLHDQLKDGTVRVLEHPTYGVNTCGELFHPKSSLSAHRSELGPREFAIIVCMENIGQAPTVVEI